MEVRADGESGCAGWLCEWQVDTGLINYHIYFNEETEAWFILFGNKGICGPQISDIWKYCWECLHRYKVEKFISLIEDDLFEAFWVSGLIVSMTLCSFLSSLVSPTSESPWRHWTYLGENVLHVRDADTQDKILQALHLQFGKQYPWWVYTFKVI